MENASKALIMAASVLIALVIIGALVLMFNNLTNYQKTDIQVTREAQIVEFNNQYETYNRKNVRGSDLYSLLNKVVDYNRRKSTSGTQGNDQGQYIAYQAMTIGYSLDGKQEELAFDKKNRIFTSQYQSFALTEANTNTFEKHIDGIIKEAIAIAKNESGIQTLAAGVSNLFDKTDERSKMAAINLWNANAKNKTDSSKSTEEQYKTINTEENKNQVYTYYEFMQFKRAKFDCVGVEYNENTGRIIEMNFKFTGKFN